jgi:hypothetical protein
VTQSQEAPRASWSEPALLLGLLSVAALVRFINLTGESLW